MLSTLALYLLALSSSVATQSLAPSVNLSVWSAAILSAAIAGGNAPSVTSADRATLTADDGLASETAIDQSFSAEEAAATSAYAQSISAEEAAASSAEVAYSSSLEYGSTSGYSILQLITPTKQASQIPVTVLASYQEDAYSFYTSFTQVDPFDFSSQIAMAVQHQPLASEKAMLAAGPQFINVWAGGITSLIDDPAPYLSRLHESASIWPASLSSSLLSQASALLTGYESIATKDILSQSPAFGPVTPGFKIDLGPAPTAAAGSQQSGAKPSTPTASATAHSAKEAAASAPAVDSKLLLSAVAGAFGLGALVML